MSLSFYIFRNVIGSLYTCLDYDWIKIYCMYFRVDCLVKVRIFSNQNLAIWNPLSQQHNDYSKKIWLHLRDLLIHKFVLMGWSCCPRRQSSYATLALWVPLRYPVQIFPRHIYVVKIYMHKYSTLKISNSPFNRSYFPPI